MKLRNLRRVDDHQGSAMCADVTMSDGRIGRVCVPIAVYEAHGQAALEQEAAALARQASAHGYRPPESDRFGELG